MSGLNPTYPSGAPMPFYGPSTDDEFITDGLEWALEMLVRRDQMNAAVHCGSTRLSPVTVKVQTALNLHRARLAAPVVATPAEPQHAIGLDGLCDACDRPGPAASLDTQKEPQHDLRFEPAGDGCGSQHDRAYCICGEFERKCRMRVKAQVELIRMDYQDHVAASLDTQTTEGGETP